MAEDSVRLGDAMDRDNPVRKLGPYVVGFGTAFVFLALSGGFDPMVRAFGFPAVYFLGYMIYKEAP